MCKKHWFRIIGNDGYYVYYSCRHCGERGRSISGKRYTSIRKALEVMGWL